MWMTVAAASMAADLQFSFSTDDGIVETASWPTFETYTRRFDPRPVGKSQVTYMVTVPSSIFDSSRGGFVVDVTVCLEWSRKDEAGQFCDPFQLVATNGAEPTKLTRTLKDKDKFGYTVEVSWTGEPPEGVNLPVTPAPAPQP